MSVDRTSKLIAIIDDDEAMQDSLRDLMEAAGLVARCFGFAEEFLESDLHNRTACLIVDIGMLGYLGVTLDDVSGWKWRAFVHREDVEWTVAKWRACVETRENFEF